MAGREDPLGWLRAQGAMGDVVDGLSRIVTSAPEGDAWKHLWTTCPRGDWLLGIGVRLGIPHRSLVRAAIGCARTSITEAEASADPLLRQALDLVARVEQWASGEGTEVPLREATAALEAATAGATSPATDAAARAALAVGLGVSDPEVLTSAAACAAEAMMMATLDCGMPLVMSYAHGKCADAVRAAVPWSEVEDCLERLA